MPAKVEMLDGFIEGVEATDWLCLEKTEDNCLEDFDFILANNITYPKVKDIKMGGVISFN